MLKIKLKSQEDACANLKDIGIHGKEKPRVSLWYKFMQTIKAFYLNIRF